MDLSQLRVFLAVVDCGSFSRAAEALYISRSTTSRSVAALEEAVGVRLLRRDNRSVRLTAAGETLYREGRQLLRQAETVEKAVRARGDGS